MCRHLDLSATGRDLSELDLGDHLDDSVVLHHHLAEVTRYPC